MVTPDKTNDSTRCGAPTNGNSHTKVIHERNRGLQEGRIYLIWWMILLAIICIGYATTIWI